MVLHKPAKPKAATSLILRSSPPADAGRLPLAVRYIEKSEGNAFAAASSVDFFLGKRAFRLKGSRVAYLNASRNRTRLW